MEQTVANAVTWGASGLVVCSASGSQSALTICTDGAGGAIVAWQDYRSGSNNDIYAQRITAAGVVQWTANGVPICTSTGSQVAPAIAPDGTGGAIIAWSDDRNNSHYDIYAAAPETS